jgi:sterol desaturase/sphingolipid hydroxylase (fatty acid hydroxylase superfamily)
LLPTVLGVAVLLALMAGLFVPLESFAARRFTRPSREALARGALCLLINSLVLRFVAAPVLHALEQPATTSLAVTVLVLFAGDLAGYAMHRAMHEVPWLWRFHALHHAPVQRELSWVDAWRQHPVDAVLHGLAVGLPGALLGASLSQLASVVVVRKLFTALLHARVDTDFGVLGRVLASPRFHRAHHADAPEAFNRNFGGTFSCWDALFDTRAPPEPSRLRQPIAEGSALEARRKSAHAGRHAHEPTGWVHH